MVIVKYPSLSRKYRTKRKRHAIALVKTRKRFSPIAYSCKVIAFLLFMAICPLLLVILPLILIVIGVVTFADTINRFGGCFDE